jgi:uncharacterized protein YdaU (DUF1376 family)
MAKVNHPPAFLFYPDDFSSDGKVEAMTTEEVGAYILLLCKSWREKPPGSLPSDDPTLARWARLPLDRWLVCRPGVLAAYTFGTDSRWHQKRLRQEFDKLITFRKSRQKAAVSMWQKKKLHARALHEQCIPSSSPISTKEEVKRSAPTPQTGAVAFVGLAFEISAVQDTALGEGFPWVDRQAEYRKADSWLLGNPNRRPKRAAAFMHNWFNRVDKPGGNRNGKPTTSEVVQSFLGHARKIHPN